MDSYLALKWIHILSATILFGTGLGTALHMWLTHRRGDVAAIAVTSRNVVFADWAFTTPSGLLQPLSGIALVHVTGHDPFAGWLVMTYGLYILAGACWLPVVWIQLQLRDITRVAAEAGQPLPGRYFRLMRIWFLLGWPAFLALIAIFYLMIARPEFGAS